MVNCGPQTGLVASIKRNLPPDGPGLSKQAQGSIERPKLPWAECCSRENATMVRKRSKTYTIDPSQVGDEPQQIPKHPLRAHLFGMGKLCLCAFLSRFDTEAMCDRRSRISDAGAAARQGLASFFARGPGATVEPKVKIPLVHPIVQIIPCSTPPVPLA